MSIVIIILTIVSLFTVLFSWAFARLWCRPKRLKSPQTPMDVQLPYTEIEFKSHGAHLRGWFIPAYEEATPGPAVIVVHGWSHNAAKMLPVARLLHRAGIATLLFDARGHGFSQKDGPITLLKFSQDILSAVCFLKNHPAVDSDRIGIVGHSMGGSSTIVAAAMDPTIRVAVTSAAFADPFQLTRLTLRRLHIPLWPFFHLIRFFIEGWLGRSMRSIAPVNLIDRISIPLLLIHGDADRFVSSTNLDTLSAAANPKYARHLLVKERRHSDVTTELQYENRMVAFIRKILCNGSLSHEESLMPSKQPVYARSS